MSAISFVVDTGVYNTHVIVVLGNKKHINKELKKMGIKKIDTLNMQGAAGYTIALKENVLLWLKQTPPYTPFNYGCLSHEIFHCCSFILSRAGVELCDKSEEAYAYLIGYISEVIMDKIRILSQK